jgi:hypothetical protein
MTYVLNCLLRNYPVTHATLAGQPYLFAFLKGKGSARQQSTQTSHPVQACCQAKCLFLRIGVLPCIPCCHLMVARRSRRGAEVMKGSGCLEKTIRGNRRLALDEGHQDIGRQLVLMILDGASARI